MDRDVVEVVARFGGTIIDVAHVGPTGTYRIGTAPAANLAVPGLTCFPIVDGRKIRRPHGIPAALHEQGIELQLGALTLWIARTKLEPARLGRPRIDWWPRIFLLASLLAHLAVWLIALSVEPFERLIEKPRPRLVQLVASPEPVEPKPARKQESAKVAQPHAATRVERPAREPRTRAEAAAAAQQTVGRSAAYWSKRVASSFDDIKLVDKLNELTPEGEYIEGDEYKDGFAGESRHFDPGPAESIKTDGYAGVMMAYDVKLCPKKSCTVTGPVPASFIRTHLHARMDEIYACYAQHADGPGTIVLEFSITPDGAVRDARGSGLGETGACAARVVGTIYFKALGNDYDPPRETRVRYPLLFKS